MACQIWLKLAEAFKRMTKRLSVQRDLKCLTFLEHQAENLSLQPFQLQPSPVLGRKQTPRKNSLQREPKQQLGRMTCHCQLIQRQTQTAERDHLNFSTSEF